MVSRLAATTTSTSGLSPGTLRWLGFLALSLAYLLAFFTRYATAVVVDDLGTSFAIGAAEIGALGAAFFWAYALMQPPAGLLADSIGTRRAVTIFTLVAGLGTLLFALAPSYPIALLGRVLGGLGTGIVYVCATRYIANWFSDRAFGTVTGAYTALGNLGGLSAAAPFAAALTLVGWRQGFTMRSGPGWWRGRRACRPAPSISRPVGTRAPAPRRSTPDEPCPRSPGCHPSTPPGQ